MATSEDLLSELGLSNQVLFEALLAHSPDKIFFKDRQSRFAVVSESMVGHFQCSGKSDLVGKTDFDFFSEEHARQAFEDEQKVIRSGKPVYREAEKETWPDGSVTWASTIKAPILVDGHRPVGVLGISRDVTREKEAHDALERHDRLLKEQNDVMRADLENARMAQGVLIPGTIRRSDRFDIAVAYDPSHGVSGDVVTFPRPDEDDCRVFLGDVCGHGVSAGIYTILVKYLADRLSREGDGRVESILGSMNEALKDVLPNRFVTAMNAVVSEGQAGTATLRISHAAHPVFFLQRRDAPLEAVRLDPAPGLGLIGGSVFDSAEFSLESGDRVVFFTDGLEEALDENGQEFGLDRLAGIVGKSQAEPVAEVPPYLLRSVDSHIGRAPKVDDRTCVVFGVR